MKYPPYPKYKPGGAEWLGDLPEQWDACRLRHISDGITVGVVVNPSSHVTDEGVPFLLGGDLREFTIDTSACNRCARDTSDGPLRKSRLSAGDLVLVRVGYPGVAAVVPSELEGANCASMMIVRKHSRFWSQWLAYVFNSRVGRDQIEIVQYDAAQKQFNISHAVDFSFPFPPLLEQRAIADFLDRETGRIDRLVGKKRELIERLKEKRTALISRTVTRGLPPDAARAAGLNPNSRLKPSGIEWLGEIPENWAVLPFTKYVAEKSDYRGKTPEKVAGGVFLVTARNVRMGYIDYDCSQEYMPEEDYDEIMRRGVPKLGDVLFTTEAPLGNVALVNRENVALAQRIIRFRMKDQYFHSPFALYAMMSDHFQLQLRSLSTGSTAEGLKASKLPLLRLVAAPIPEQRAIADYLDRETAKLDRMIAKAEEAVERLQEYRTALITAAVTGKIDVRQHPT